MISIDFMLENQYKVLAQTYVFYSIPPKDWRFQPHKDWRYLWEVAKENCYTNQHKEKIPIEIFDPQKNNLSGTGGKSL